jgi:hypothetical protein
MGYSVIVIMYNYQIRGDYVSISSNSDNFFVLGTFEHFFSSYFETYNKLL